MMPRIPSWVQPPATSANDTGRPPEEVTALDTGWTLNVYDTSGIKPTGTGR